MTKPDDNELMFRLMVGSIGQLMTVATVADMDAEERNDLIYRMTAIARQLADILGYKSKSEFETWASGAVELSDKLRSKYQRLQR